MTASQIVNKLGKYLYNNLDGAFKLKTSSNMVDVYFTVLYQLPLYRRNPYKGEEYNDVHEMTVDLNITTYQNKIRVNLITVTPEAKTIGYDLYPPVKMEDLPVAKSLIYNKVVKRLSKEFEEYEFLF